MSQQEHEIEVFFHREGSSPKVVRAKPADTIADVLSRAGLPSDHGLHVFVGESEAALCTEDDETEDSQESVSARQTLGDLGIGRHAHVHCHRCLRIKVTVNYNGQEKRRAFSPTATIATVLTWAKRRFRLTDADADKLVLQLCGTTTRPRLNEHLGELVSGSSCELCFDLVFDQKVEGRSEVSEIKPPDRRALEADFEDGPFRIGESLGHWGLPDVAVLESPIIWPNVVLWVAAASRANGPERFYLRIECSDYPRQAPTGNLWDLSTNGFLSAEKRPKGTGRVEMVFRTNWKDGAAFYHPYDRATLDHPDWPKQYPWKVWTTNHTVVDLLSELYSLLNSVEYTGV